MPLLPTDPFAPIDIHTLLGHHAPTPLLANFRPTRHKRTVPRVARPDPRERAPRRQPMRSAPSDPTFALRVEAFLRALNEELRATRRPEHTPSPAPPPPPPPEAFEPAPPYPSPEAGPIAAPETPTSPEPSEAPPPPQAGPPLYVAAIAARVGRSRRHLDRTIAHLPPELRPHDAGTPARHLWWLNPDEVTAWWTVACAWTAKHPRPSRAASTDPDAPPPATEPAAPSPVEPPGTAPKTTPSPAPSPPPIAVASPPRPRPGPPHLVLIPGGRAPP